MSADRAAKVATVIAIGTANAAGMARPSIAFDVWSHSYDGLATEMQDFADDPAGFARNYAEQRERQREAMAPEHWESSSGQEARASWDAQFESLRGQLKKFTSETEQADGTTRAKTALEYVGQTFQLLTAAEQMVSTWLSVIPFPAFPALRVMDMDIGFPHGHAHPPNTPPPPPIPLPSTGPVIPIPFISGATRTLINGRPAARCGDMGLGIWCGGYFPMYEVFLGSSSVWIENQRAARVLCDLTKHCIFRTPKPSDFPLYTFLGLTVTCSPNVLIGGVPMPWLTALAIGAAFKGLFALAGKATKFARSKWRKAPAPAEQKALPPGRTPTPEQQARTLPGHGHARHGSHTTIAQQTTRVQTGVTPDGLIRRTGRATRFDSPEAELDAVRRAQARTANRVAAGQKSRAFVVSPDGTIEVPRDTSVVTGYPGGYGSGVEVIRRPVTNQALPGRPVAPTGQDPNALVVLRYDPTTQTWQPVTQYPTNRPVTP